MSRDRDPELDADRLNELREIAPKDPSQVPIAKTRELLKSPTAEIREDAAYVLANVVTLSEEDWPKLIDDFQTLLTDESPTVRKWGAYSIAVVGEEYPEEIRRTSSDLKSLLDDDDISVRAHATMALAALAAEYPEDVRSVEDTLQHLSEKEGGEMNNMSELALGRINNSSKYNGSTKTETRSDHGKQISSQDISREDLESTDPYNFEQLVADVWEAKGYDTTVRSKSGDEGIDVEAEKTGYKEVIQVKRYNINNKLGSEDIRFYATLYQQEPEANSVVIVTSGEFTKAGRALADKLKVDTLNGDELINEIQEYDVKLKSVSGSFEQEQSNDNSLSETGLDSSGNSESLRDSNHPFGSQKEAWKSNKLGSECPACNAIDSIWEAENSTNENTSLKCHMCDTRWWNQKNTPPYSSSSTTVWTARGGHLDGASGTLQEWRNGNHSNDLDSETGCFIATAAFGTPHAEEIDELREFRDNILLSNTLGEMFVDAYYRFSPPIAEWISESERRKKTTRRLVIDPSLWFVRKIQ